MSWAGTLDTRVKSTHSSLRITEWCASREDGDARDALIRPTTAAGPMSLHEWLDSNGVGALKIPLDDYGVEELHDLGLLDPEDIQELKKLLKKVQVRGGKAALSHRLRRPPSGHTALSLSPGWKNGWRGSGLTPGRRAAAARGGVLA